jgi:hypothetical protein
MVPRHLCPLAAATGSLLLVAGCRDVVQEPGLQPEVVLTAPVSYYVSPAGANGGDGSSANPWSLTTALAGGNGAIRPGDTLWLREGVYSGALRTSLAGAPGLPIVFRQYPGERATLDGSLRVDGPDVVFWGFEIMRSNPNDALPGLEIHGARTRFVNLVVHDAAGQGIALWDEADDAVVYGCVVYNNGTHQNLDHGIYLHSPHAGAARTVEDNIFFTNLSHGIHAYARFGNDPQSNIRLIGNVSFNNGTIEDSAYQAKPNLLVGGVVPYSGVQVIDNLLFLSDAVARVSIENMRVGDDTTVQNGDAVVRGNYVLGGATVFRLERWSLASVDSNMFGGTDVIVRLLKQSLTGFQWTSNTHFRDPASYGWRYAGHWYPWPNWQRVTGLGASDVVTGTNPAAPRVFVRPNRYEQGRAHVVVYNWGGAAAAPVDLSSVLQPGDGFEVRNVQRVFGPPVLQGTYSGGSVSFPMDGVDPPVPAPGSNRIAPRFGRTAPAFDAFVVLRASR